MGEGAVDTQKRRDTWRWMGDTVQIYGTAARNGRGAAPL